MAVYLKCNLCTATYDLKEWGPDGERRMSGAHWSHARKLRAEAKADGWVAITKPPTSHTLSDTVDYCPDCAAKLKKLNE